jgi:hypothetical protein
MSFLCLNVFIRCLCIRPYYTYYCVLLTTGQFCCVRIALFTVNCLKCISTHDILELAVLLSSGDGLYRGLYVSTQVNKRFDK